MRVSWLIPVRDCAPWLRAAVDSALAQCGPHDEVIVVDDGSQDGGHTLLPQGVRLLRQPPLGIVAALEAGRAVAQGSYIARLDADDVALPGRIEAQLAALESQPQLAAIGGRASIHGHEDARGMQRYVDWVNGIDDVHVQLLVESPLFHPAVTFRAQAVSQVGGYKQGPFPEDYELWLRLAAAGYRLANLPQQVLRILDRPERLTRTDPRYSRAAFRMVKQQYLSRTLLREPCRVVLWGAGKTGVPWLRWLLAQGHTVPAVIDLKVGERQGRPVVLQEALMGLAPELVLVAVGARGARSHIRERLHQLSGGRWVEGRDWVAVA